MGDLKSSTQIVEKEDQLPPAPPHFNATQTVTAEPRISLSGTSEAGSLVKLTLNNQLPLEVITNKSGYFNFDSISLKNGENSIFALAIDAAGNKSERSRELTILFDDEPPLLEIISPTSGSRFYDEELE